MYVHSSFSEKRGFVMKILSRLRFYIAMAAAKTSRILLKIIGKNATYLPGLIALKLDKNFLGGLKKPDTLVCVTGTNGKTTTSNMITDILRDNGYSVTNNGFGSNVQAGVATALLADSSFFGKPKNEIAVIEVDERSSLLVYKYISPDYLVATNITRDSMKRNAHAEFITFIVNKALPATTKVVLNGDDLISSFFGKENTDRTYYGLDCEISEAKLSGGVKDIVYCPVCNGKMDAEYIRYNHIGRYKCTECDFVSPKRAYTVTNIDRENKTLTVSYNSKEYHLPLINDNIVNVYNTCAVTAFLNKFGLSFEQIAASLSKTQIVKSRFDTEKVGEYSITMQLSKGQNPIATSRSVNYIAGIKADKKAVLLMCDDIEEKAESACWIYDCDYTPLADDSIKQIIFAGKRCRDHLLRALLAGVDENKISICENPADGAALINPECKNVYILYQLYLVNEAKKAKSFVEKTAKGEN